MKNHGGDFEPESLAAWAEMCDGGKAGTAIDVGAYAGLFAIAASLLGNRSIAIEAKPILAQRTAINARLNGTTVEMIEAAASDRDGLAILHTTTTPLSSMSSLVNDDNPRRSVRMKVKRMKLDSLNVGRIGAIKIDVEGHEPEVLKGAKDIILEHKPSFIIETLASNEDSKRRVRNLLPDYREVAFLDGRNLYLEPR